MFAATRWGCLTDLVYGGFQELLGKQRKGEFVDTVETLKAVSEERDAWRGDMGKPEEKGSLRVVGITGGVTDGAVEVVKKEVDR